MNSLTTLFALGAQTAKGVYPTSFQAFRGSSVEANPTFDYIEAQGQMAGVHERSSRQQSVPERIAFSAPISVEAGFYPKSFAYALMGIGFVPSAASGTGPYTYKFVKSNVHQAPYVSGWVGYGEGTERFFRRLKDGRLTSVAVSMSRTQSMITMAGMFLDEDFQAVEPATVIPEVDSMFLPTLGGMVWNAGTGYNYGIPREHVITFERNVEETDQKLHTFGRNDVQELDFNLSGQLTGLDFSMEFYRKMIYGDEAAGTIPDAATLTASLSINVLSGRDTPTFPVPYDLTIAMPEVEMRLTNFRAQGSNVIRADGQWVMIDNDAAPPVLITLISNTVTMPTFGTAYADAGGT